MQEFAPNGAHAALFLVDFDDTLLPSTWLRQLGSMEQQNLTGIDTVQICRELGILEHQVAAFLCRLLAFGRVVLVTNAVHGWIQASCHKFMPKVAALLPLVKMVSARTKFESYFPGQPEQWKLHAFREELASSCCRRKPSLDKFSVISMGDSWFEREAVLVAGREHGAALLVKSVQLVERPEPHDICSQLAALSNCIHAIISCGENLDLLMQRGGRVTHHTSAPPSPPLSSKPATTTAAAAALAV